MPSYTICGYCASQNAVFKYAEPTTCAACDRARWVQVFTDRESVSRAYLNGALVGRNIGNIDINRIEAYLHGRVTNTSDAMQGYEDYMAGLVRINDI